MTRRLLGLLAASLLVLSGCPDTVVEPVSFAPPTVTVPDARPGFTSSTTVTLVNNTGSSYRVNGLSFSADEAVAEDAERFEVVLADGSSLPAAIAGGESLELTVVFSPLGVRSYEATLTAALSLEEFRLAGGGISTGCGDEAPDDGQIFAAAQVTGTGDEEAGFEDCTDGIDNDDDELVDCDDPDCATDAACQPDDEICDDGEDNDDDGLVDCDDPDCAADPACGGEDEICDDGIDNNGDGRVDCDDPQCFDDPDCIQISGCELQGDLRCNESVQDNTQGGEDLWQSYCGVPQPRWNGPEHVWLYAPEQPGPVEVALWGPGIDLDLTILEAPLDDELRCDPDACAATSWSPPNNGPEVAQFEAQPGFVYFIVVDGFDGDAGQYELFVECAGKGEEICDNGLDDDGDGLEDCNDPDCFTHPDCIGQGSCQPIDVLECPQTFMNASNGGPGTTNDVEDWCGEGFDAWTGPEIAYIFLPNTDGEVTLSLSGLSDDLDMTVLLANLAGPDDEACDPNLCVDNDWGPGSQPEEITFEAFAGTPYIVAIDGWQGAVSNFILTLDCGGQAFEFQCDDGIDNDGDGLTDCADDDCFFDPSCQNPGGEICNDGADNDADGLVDCDDLEDCSSFPGCDSGGGDCCDANGSPGCDNQLGEDCVCSLDPFCCDVDWDALCVDAYENQCGGSCDEPITEICDDGIDNDNDGLVDCSDVDCFGDPACVGPAFEFNCSNGLDDDLDGLVDCADFDCTFDPACLTPDPEDCDNGVDDDNDGAVDCEDSDCAFDPVCDSGDGECCLPNGSPGCEDEVGEDCVCAADPFCCNVEWDGLCAQAYEDSCGGVCTGVEVCDNGLDDDADGLADCDDPDCAGDPSCVGPGFEFLCDDGIDNDNDGLIDCDDFDCLFLPECLPTPEVCDDNVDNDGNGLIDCADPACFLDPNCNLPGVENNCANGLDDDGDGAIDCDDSDCTLDPNCNVVAFETDCDNGIDDDNDALVDCADSDCAAHPDCIFGDELVCDNGIDDDADGLTDCNDSDCTLDPNCAHAEFDCADNIDNDGDGLIDCDDDDCSASVECVQAGNCNPIGDLRCGDVITGANNMPGSTNQQDVYCGFNPGGWSGPEVSWVFTPTYDGTVDITLTGLSADLDIQALVDDGGCDQDDCEANGWNPPPQPESMDWYAFAGTPYYILIDGWQGAVSNFTMTVTCTSSSESDCADGIDNDLDGDLDCADIDCLGDSDCPELACGDGIDNDADGFIDCNDVDCFGTPTCLPELNCVDGVDNDSDGSIDCDDSDCAGVPACQPESDCEDGVDNDGDGAIDCDDEDCLDNDACAEPVELDCADGLDNDGDGQVDCDDLDCSLFPGCIGPDVEICDDGLDNDFDGDEDCFDSDCTGFPGCDVETVCDDGFDNDTDGLADCNDTDCYGEPGCPVLLFSSVDDDPADFVHFPRGGHTSTTAWEQGVPDTAAQSGNGPATAHTGTDAWCTGCGDPAVDGGRFNAYLVAQPAIFDLSPYTSGTLALSFVHWQVAPPFFLVDLSRVQVSIDGGNTLDDVWGPNATSTLGWEAVEIDLTAYLGEQLTLGFLYDSLNGWANDADGWYIDDVELIWTP